MNTNATATYPAYLPGRYGFAASLADAILAADSSPLLKLATERLLDIAGSPSSERDRALRTLREMVAVGAHEPQGEDSR